MKSPDKADSPVLELNGATLVPPEPSTAAPAGAGPKAAEDDRFDWNEDDAVLIETQPPTAIYRGGAGHVVIRQERRDYEDDDRIILILPDFLDRVIKRLTAIRNGAD
jgi:hypothetical protein